LRRVIRGVERRLISAGVTAETERPGVSPDAEIMDEMNEL
jgi:hypothetical protein